MVKWCLLTRGDNIKKCSSGPCFASIPLNKIFNFSRFRTRLWSHCRNSHKFHACHWNNHCLFLPLEIKRSSAEKNVWIQQSTADWSTTWQQWSRVWVREPGVRCKQFKHIKVWKGQKNWLCLQLCQKTQVMAYVKRTSA